MSALDVPAIEARAAAATPGPWLIDREELSDDFSDEEQATAYPQSIGPIVDWEHEKINEDGRDGIAQIEADAAFVAAAREDVPALCVRVREADAYIERMEAEIAEHDDREETLRSRVRELEAAVHLVAEPRHGEPTTGDLALVTCPTCLRRVAAAERALRTAEIAALGVKRDGGGLDDWYAEQADAALEEARGVLCALGVQP